MPAPLRIQCPHCQAQLQLKSRESVGKKFRCRSCREVFKIEEPAEVDNPGEPGSDAQLDSQLGARERRATSTISKRAPKRSARPKRSLSTSQRYVAAGVAGAALVCGLFFVPWGKLSRAVNNFSPFSDSAHSVLSDLENLSRDYGKLLDSVVKGKPVAKAMSSVKDLLAETENLYLRAARLRPHSKEDILDLIKRHPRLTNPLDEGLFQFDRKARVRLMESAQNEVESEFVPKMAEIRRQGDMILEIVKNLDAPPEPTDARGRTEAAMIDVLYDAIDDMTGFNSAGDLKSGAAEISAHAQRLKTLAGQLPGGGSSFGGETSHDLYRTMLIDRIDEVEEILSARYGNDASFASAVQELMAGDSPHGEPMVDMPRGPTGVSSDRGNQRPPIKPQTPETPREAKGNVGPIVTQGTPEPFGVLRTPLKSRDDLRQYFYNRCGKENSLFIFIPGQHLTATEHGLVVTNMRKIAGRYQHSRSFHDPDLKVGSAIGFQLSNDVQELAKAMTFAKVREVDVPNRTITIEPVDLAASSWSGAAAKEATKPPADDKPADAVKSPTPDEESPFKPE